MTYCAKCGTKNEDDAEFCKKCGAELGASRKEYGRRRDDRCEEECAGGKNGHGWGIFWGVIIVLIGLWIIVEFVLKKIAASYTGFEWVNSFDFGWVFAIVIALFIIIFGLRIISRRS
jgi:uncharacterized membrane protein YvbJ